MKNWFFGFLALWCAAPGLAADPQSAKQVALSDNRYKIHSNDGGKSFALYDLIGDPGESKDLASEKPEIHQAMIKTVTAWQKSCKASDAGEDYR